MLRLLAEHAATAADTLPGAAYDYYATGSGDEVTLDEASGAWLRYRFRPRMLRDVTRVDTGCTVLGARLSAPVLVAPTAFQSAAHPDGECATMRAAGTAGSLMVVSARCSRRIEDIAAAAGAPWWYQVYVMADRQLTHRVVGRAVDAGAAALVLTVDTPYTAVKRRSGAGLPVTDEQYLINFADHLAAGADTDAATTQYPGCTMDILSELAEFGVPVLVKGVLRGDDATACLDAGAAGVIVSNHGGRQLDRAVDTAYALREVADAVGGRAPVLVDGGIRSGRDVLTALALGADATLLGRPVLWALAAGGSEAVTAALDAVRDDLAEALALAGLTGVGRPHADLLVEAPR